MDSKQKQNKFLIIDDDEQVIFSLKTSLKMSGYAQLFSCDDSRNVEKLLKNLHIDIILLDVNMPYINGKELLPIISKQYPETQIIVISADSDINTISTCYKNGCADYLVKPVNRNKLLFAISNIVKKTIPNFPEETTNEFEMD